MRRGRAPGPRPPPGATGRWVTLRIALCWPAACVICDQLFISCTTYGSEGQRWASDVARCSRKEASFHECYREGKWRFGGV